jgi:hypothetical protein
VAVADWLQRLRSSAALRDGGIAIKEETSPQALLESLTPEANPPLAVLNPYGEGLPLAPGTTMPDAVERIGEYVRRGGTWVEVGGWPFFYALRPRAWLSYSTTYPAGFADFQHLETDDGSMSVYRVAPRTRGPWESADDPFRAFVPGELGHGRDAEGPFCRRVFHPYVLAGAEWVSPTVRLSFGRDPLPALRDYAQANALVRPLAEKMDAERLSRFRKSVLIYCGGPARELLGALDSLPSPSILHTADYLQGGFDKQYPDHLPPRPGFGTEEELRTLTRECERRGILFCPYTNPTWWCDHPRGPTFERCGEAPLARGLDGRPCHEVYGANDGWTITFWHPDVRAANRETVRRFTEDLPVGLLFQDQCGARGWVWDANPASPSPSAYTEGLISMVEEDSALAPLSTEGGWDRLLPYESQFCGMTWALVPTEWSPPWVTLLRDRYPEGTYEPFPVAQAIGHESVAMIHHDLGQFVTNPEVLAWTVGIGFGMSYRVAASGLANPNTREWLHWIDAIQKSVCARYIGAALGDFEVLGGPTGAGGGAPLLHTRYGDLDVVANTGGSTRAVPGRDGTVLAAYGFDVRAPGLRAGGIQELGGRSLGEGGAWLVCDSGADEATLHLYAIPGAAVAVPLPEGWATVSAATSADGDIRVEVRDRLAWLTTPGPGGAQRPARHVYEIGLRR